MASLNFDYKKDNLSSTNYECIKKVPRLKIGLKDEWLAEPLKGRYNPGVLVGNWFDRRSDYVPPLEDWKTVHDLTYTCKQNPYLEEDRLKQHEFKIKIEVRLINKI